MSHPLYQSPSMPIYPIIRENAKTYKGRDVRPFLVLRILQDHIGQMLSRRQIREISAQEHGETMMTDHIIECAVVTAREAGFEIELFMASPSGSQHSKYVKYYKLKADNE